MPGPGWTVSQGLHERPDKGGGKGRGAYAGGEGEDLGCRALQRRVVGVSRHVQNGVCQHACLVRDLIPASHLACSAP